MKRANLNDLANSLGLSTNTVSRALAGKDGVAPHTRDRVLREADRIDYRTGSQWRRRHAKTIALTVTSSTNVFISQFIAATVSALRPVGYAVSIRITEESSILETRAIAEMASGDYAGALVIPVQGRGTPWADAGEFPFPIVAVAREIPDVEYDSVSLDQQATMYAATRHVLAQGARSLLLFDEDLDVSSNRSRVAGFKSAVETEEGTSGRVVLVPTRRFESSVRPWQPEEGYRSVYALLSQGLRPDAMLFEDDYYALGALRAIEDQGLRVPHDILLVGFGNHPYAPYMKPALTTVAAPGSLIAEAAVSMLLRRIAGDMSPPVRRLLDGELIVRESSVKQNSLNLETVSISKSAIT